MKFSCSLVHDARAVLNEAKSNTQLVLITTKTGYNKESGFTVAASEHLVKDSTLSPLHRLYVSGRKYYKGIGIGGSASYLHEVFPLQSGYKPTSGTENRLNSLSFYAWLTAEFGTSKLVIRLNAAPTDSSSDYVLTDNNQGAYDVKQKTKNLQLLPSASFTTALSKNFHNEMNVSYLSYSYRNSVKYKGTAPGVEEQLMDRFRNSEYLLLFRDRIGYVTQANDWTFNPAFNLNGSFTTVKTKDEAFYAYNNSIAAGSSTMKLKQRQLIFSPTFDVSHSSVFGLQLGAQYRMGRANNQKKTKENVYPFGSLSIDPVKLFNPSSAGSVLLHVSHARAKSDLVNYQPNPQFVYVITNGAIDTVVIANAYKLSYKPQRVTDAGVTAKITRSLRLLYTYENNSYYINIPAAVYQPSGSPFTRLDEAAIHIKSHRLGLEFKTTEEKIVRYSATASLYKMNSSFGYDDKQLYWEVIYKNYYPRNGLSGGFTNDFNYKSFSAGLNALYYFNEHDWMMETNGTIAYESILHKRRSFVLQNVYAGFQVKNVNMYVSARNLFGSDESSFINTKRKYFGVGVKADL